MYQLLFVSELNQDKIFYILIFVLIITAVITISFYFDTKNRVLRKLKKVKAKKILLVKENEYAKIIGKAQVLDQPIISPISKRKCVYYQVKILQKTGGKNQSWRTIVKDEKQSDFVIESSGEKAIVKAATEPQNKMVYLTKDEKRRSGTWNDAPKHLEHYLNANGKSSEGIFGFNKTLKYYEGVIEVGEEITVLGMCNRQESDHNFDRYSSETLFISGKKPNKLLITDDPAATK